MTARLRSVPGNGAALGWAGAHTLVVDRPEGVAGGTGLGFNGGQLLALAIGGCLCNDLHHVAQKRGVRLDSVEVEVTVAFAGEPLLATAARVRVAVEAEEADAAELVRLASEVSTVGNSVARGFPVEVTPA